MSYQSVNEPCSILEQDGKCGETESLAIIKEFKRQYESKMSKIDNEAGGDNLPGLQAKVLLQREWIRDLTAQNELLIRAMEELEKEATERVIMLESRLKHQAEKTNEVMQKYISINLDEIFQNLVYLQSDVRNLLKFIKRIREEDSWNIDGLKFHNITCQDLFGTDCDCSSVCLHEMSSKEKGCSGGPCLDYNKINAELENNLKEKEKQLVDISAKYNQKCEEAITAKRSLMDVRNALTVEVAEKHDVILNLRRDVQQLEENIRQSNKQILFKDDIIKELRKEIKSFKDEEFEDKNTLLIVENMELNEKCLKLKNELKSMKSRYAEFLFAENVDLPDELSCLCFTNEDKKLGNISQVFECENIDQLKEKFSNKSVSTTSIILTSSKLLQCNMATCNYYDATRSQDSISETTSTTSDETEYVDSTSTSNLYDSSNSDQLQYKLNSSLESFSPCINSTKVNIEDKSLQTEIDDKTLSNIQTVIKFVESMIGRRLSSSEKKDLNLHFEKIQIKSRPSLLLSNEVLNSHVHMDKIASIENEVENFKKLTTADCFTFFKLGNQINDLLKNLHKKDKNIAQMKDLIRYLIEKLIMLQEKLNELQKELTKYNSLDTQETYEVLKNKIQVLQTEIENLRKTLVQEQEHLNEAEKRIHSLMTERDALKIKNDELLNQFKIEKNNYIKEIDELKRKNKLSENAYVELEKANATHTLELESSKRTSRVLNMDLEKLASEINEKDSIITSLEKDLRELQKQNKKALDQIVTLTVENQAKVEKIEENQAILKHLEDRKEIITGVKNFECTDAEVSFNSSNHKNIADKGSSRSVKFNDAAVASSSSGNWVTSDSASTDDEEIERQTVRVVKTLEQTVSTDSSDQRRINELEKALERALTERENERSKHNQEIFNLRKAIEELEKSGQNEICKGHNLQNAVDLYRNSIILLEANEERARSEINLQRQTIQNLQESLVITKRQLEQYQQKSSRDVSGWFGGWFGSNSSNVLKPSISENEFLHEI